MLCSDGCYAPTGAMLRRVLCSDLLLNSYLSLLVVWVCDLVMFPP
jgi:hypothetical protein